MSAQPTTRHPEFDWDRAAQLQAINSLKLPEHLSGLGRPVSAATLIGVLRVIDDHQREKANAWPSLATLEKCSRVSKKTVQRVIDCLERLGLLTVWEERTERGYPRLTMAISWQLIFSERLPATEVDRSESEAERLLAPTSSTGWRDGRFVISYTGPKRSRGPVRDQLRLSIPEPRPGDTGASPGDTETRPVDTGSTALCMNRPLNRLTEPTSPSPQDRQRSDRRAPQRAGWLEVEEELTQAGVNSLACLQQARRHVSAGHALELIRWWLDRREIWHPDHQPGVLYVRIQRAREYLAVDEGWRDPNPERLARWKRRQQTPEPLPASLSPARESIESSEDLETQHGAKLDALSDPELAALAASLGPYMQKAVRQRGRNSRAVRGVLLLAISKRHGEAKEQ